MIQAGIRESAVERLPEVEEVLGHMIVILAIWYAIGRCTRYFWKAATALTFRTECRPQI
jgi:hypothetical protein